MNYELVSERERLVDHVCTIEHKPAVALQVGAVSRLGDTVHHIYEIHKGCDPW